MASQTWKERNPEKHRASVAASQRRHRLANRNNPEFQEQAARTRRASHFKQQYAMKQSDYDALLVEQDGVCAICRQPETKKMAGKTMLLAVDHDHQTGRVRGLLCNICNRALGLFNDQLETVEAAAVYLRQILVREIMDA